MQETATGTPDKQPGAPEMAPRHRMMLTIDDEVL